MATGTARVSAFALLAALLAGEIVGCGSSGSSIDPGLGDASPVTPTPRQVFTVDAAAMPDSTTTCSGGACSDAATTVCGDGVVGTGEQCDDGNSTPGDGCSGVCQIEPGYTCPTPAALHLHRRCRPAATARSRATKRATTATRPTATAARPAARSSRAIRARRPASRARRRQTPVCGDGDGQQRRAVRRRQHERRRRLQRDLPARAGLHVPDARQRLHDAAVLRRRRRSGRAQRAVRRRQRDTRATAAPASARSSRATRARRPASRASTSGSAATATSTRARPATTATRWRATAAARTARRSSRATRARTSSGSGGPCTAAAANSCGDGDRSAASSSATTATTTRATAARRPAPSEAGLHLPDRRRTPCTKIEFCGDGMVEPRHQRAVRRRQHGLAATAAARLCQLEPNYVCPTPGAAVRLDRQVRRRQGHRHRDVRRRQRRLGRRLLLDLPDRGRLAVPDAGRQVHREEVRRRHRRRHRAVRRRQRRLGRRLQRDLHARAGLRLRRPGRAAQVGVPRDDVRRRRQGGLRAVRRRQPDPVRRLLADLHRRAEVRRAAPARRSAATASSSRRSSATTATRSRATAAAPTCTHRAGLAPCTAVNQAPPASLVIPILYRDLLYNGHDGARVRATRTSNRLRRTA